MHNLLSNCGLVDARISAYDKDLLVYIKRIPGYSTFPSTFGLWCHCGQILTSILSGWLTYCMTDNCSSLQRQTSTVYEFSKEEASLTVRKVKPFVTAALATSSVCTVKQPSSRGDEHLSKRLWFFEIFPNKIIYAVGRVEWDTPIL